MQLGIERQTDFRRAYSHHFAFVCLGASQIVHQFSQDIILCRTDVGNLSRDKLMDGEDVRHFDVQRRLGPGVQIIELVNVKLRFRVSDGNHFVLS